MWLVPFHIPQKIDAIVVHLPVFSGDHRKRVGKQQNML
jgi:hypothetical protein